MSCAILGLGTALPPTAVKQTDAVRIAAQICCRSGEQADLLPNLYRQTAIDTRHLAFDQDVIDDVLGGTTRSGSVFLPRGPAGDPGPTTRQRMEHYVARAGPLALRASRQALEHSGLAPAAVTHIVTVSCTGFSAPGVDVALIDRKSTR